MKKPFIGWPGIVVVFLGSLTCGVGCDSGSSAPVGPPPLDRSTPQAALVAYTEYYGTQDIAQAASLLAPDYRYFPAEPDSISFLEDGETSWDVDQELEILSLLLVPNRVNWLDQVLFEIVRRTVTPVNPDSTVWEVEAEVDLIFLVGANQAEAANGDVLFTLRRNADGNYELIEERVLTVDSAVGLGRHKTRVFDPEAP